MDNLYYISQGISPGDHLNNIHRACLAGCRLIQLRLKNISDKEHLCYAEKALEISKRYSAQLIINDSIEVAKKCNASGVHLGKKDSTPTQARELLGKERIVGGTANTLDDCISIASQKVDYIGLGPFRYTTTKKNLSPLLGLDGYRHAISELRKRMVKTPIYAIGGIRVKDFEALIETKINGIAVSSLFAGKSEEQIKQIIEQYQMLIKVHKKEI